jgi:hypothetical protein
MGLLLGRLVSGTEPSGDSEDLVHDFIRTFLWQEMAAIWQGYHLDMLGDHLHHLADLRSQAA